MNKLADEMKFLKKVYLESDLAFKWLLKKELYLDDHLSEYVKDVVWEYLNEPEDSVFHLNYSQFCERLKFYENNFKFYSADDK